MLEAAPSETCCCLPAREGKAARRSNACPMHGCTCGVGRHGRAEDRAKVDGSCPSHGTTAAPGVKQAGRPARVVPPLDPAVLAEVDLEILALEKEVFKYQGAKDQRAAEVIGGRYGGVTPTRYYQRLNQLIDHPEANRLEPALCDRLRTQREDRRP
ncbi:DUF3263 domain-containing protein [Kocuria rosea]|uniref:DUF3263 domain-containing protein n=1 Tax=Kocuria rosea TaxID=1275 RepID=UPI003D32A1EF